MLYCTCNDVTEEHLPQVLVLASEEPEEEGVQLSWSQLPLVSQQDERLDQAPAQCWVQHCIVGIQQLHDFCCEPLCVLREALADLHGQAAHRVTTNEIHHAHCEVSKLTAVVL